MIASGGITIIVTSSLLRTTFLFGSSSFFDFEPPARDVIAYLLGSFRKFDIPMRALHRQRRRKWWADSPALRPWIGLPWPLRLILALEHLPFRPHPASLHSAVARPT